MKIAKITISKAAKMAGVGVETIRYYQRIGLIEKPPKPPQGYRIYPEQTVARIRFIKRAQSIGFTLKEIDALLHLNEQQCSEISELAKAKLQLVQQRIADMQSIQTTLQGLITHCETRSADEACPIIDAFLH